MKTSLKCILCVLAASVIATLLSCENAPACKTEGFSVGVYTFSRCVTPKDGSDGSNGSDGVDGINTVIQVIPVSSCTDGGYTLLTAQDSNVNGFPDGLDSNFQSTEICNGSDGTDGTNSIPLNTALFYDPCGNFPTLNDEVFILVENGPYTNYLASFSANVNGDYTRFALLEPGNYQTTDGTTCFFTIDSNGEITDEHY